MISYLLLLFFIQSIFAAQCAQQTIGFYTYPATDEGRVVTLDCDQKELYTGSVTRRCLAGGVWESPSIQCTRNTCPAQSLIGSAIWPKTPTNENVTVACHWGQTGSQTRRCNLDMTWAQPYSTCKECNCPENVDDVYHLKWTSGMCDVMYNNRNCPEGFSGMYLRSCSRDGNWNPVSNECVAMVCNAEFYQDVFWNETAYNTTITVNCPAGYTGTITRYCNVKFQWEDPVSHCIFGPPYFAYNETRFLGKVGSPMDPIFPSYFVNLYGTVVAYGLPPGLILMPTNGYISGTPTAGGSYRTRIQATNQAGSYSVDLTFVIISIVCEADHGWPQTNPEDYAPSTCFLGIGHKKRYCGVDQETGGAVWERVEGTCAGDWTVLLMIVGVVLACIGLFIYKRYQQRKIREFNMDGFQQYKSEHDYDEF